MAHPIEESYKRLHDRAAEIQSLVGKDTRKPIRESLQKAYASLLASAELLLEMEDESHVRVKKTLAAAAKHPRPAKQIEALATMIAVLERFPELLESGELLSKGKDLEAMKHIAKEALKTAVEVGVIISGAKTVKDVADLLRILEDVARTGQSMKMRRQQVAVASDLLDWVETITVACLSWSYVVQRYLLDIEGKVNASDDDVLQLVSDRVVKHSRRWKPQK